MPAGPCWQVGVGRRAEQTEQEAAALGVSITISYVSGGTHSPLYKVSLSAHASPVAGEYSFSPAFFPPLTSQWPKIDGRDQWLSQWASLRVVDAHPECILVPLWVLSVACTKPFLLRTHL